MEIRRLIDRVRGKLTEARELIYESEITANRVGVYVADILEMTNKKVKNPYVSSVVKRLKGRTERIRAYRGVLPADVLDILKVASEKNVNPGELFESYVRLKRELDKAESRLIGALMGPAVSYVVYSILVVAGLMVVISRFKQIPELDVSEVEFIKDAYLYTFWTPLVVIGVLIRVIPHKIPVWKRVYTYVKSAQYLLLTKTMYRMGLSGGDVVDVLKKSRDKMVATKARRLPKEMHNVHGLVKILVDYLEPMEAALLEVGVKFSREEEIIDTLVDRKLRSVEGRVRSMENLLGKLNVVAIAVPMVVFVVAALVLMSTVFLNI